jgi:predicted SAM-dependent methyltransferase
MADSTLRERILRVPGARPTIGTAYRARNAARERRRRKTIERRDRRTLKGLAGRHDLRLNIGSSDNHLPGWLSIDKRADEICFGMDAAKPWPFASESAEGIFSEHFIEHLTVAEARVYLREAFRVLRPGGLLRTTTPDLEGICRLYLEGDPHKLAIHRSHGYEAQTPGDMVNNYFYCWEHRHIYDFVSLARLLEDFGFTRVERAEFSESRHDLLRGLERHDVGELGETVLSVDAVKPLHGRS